MRLALVLSLACSLFACSSGDLGAAQEDGDASPADDGGASADDDAATTADASTTDGGGTTTDGGATKTDSGSTTKDSGSTTTDSGSTKSDSGSTPTDTGTADTGGTTTPDAGGDPLALARTTCVDEINKYRATEGKPPYVGWSAAETCADGQAKSDSASGTAHGAFGKCGESAQNECPGWPGPPETMIKSCLKMMWAEGPGEPFSAHGHYINMSSTKYTKVACGFYKTASGSWWAVQDFR